MAKFPQVKVQLSGEDGNSFFILGRVLGAARRAKLDKATQDAYVKEATSGDYDNLLATTMDWFDCS